jgi:hypothetical protein
MTPSGIDPATFRLVEQSLDELRHHRRTLLAGSLLQPADFKFVTILTKSTKDGKQYLKYAFPRFR